MRGERIEVYRDRAGEYRWTWKAANHEKVADSGEGYSTYYKAHEAADRARQSNPEVPIMEADEQG